MTVDKINKELTMDRRSFMKSASFGAAALAVSGIRVEKKRPNIIFIMSDDHASHAISCYGSRINSTPNIDRIARNGIRFENCFCTNGICAPSRAVLLSGKHSHLNGVRDNTQSFDGTQPTFPKILRQAGYATAMIGKWHLKSDPTGFDYWNILPGQGDYYNPVLIEMGEKKEHNGYVTDLLTEFALDYLKSRREEAKPFLLMLHHKAPHRNWQPALRHLRMYDDTIFPEPDTLFDDYQGRQAAGNQEMTIKDHMDLDYDLKMGDPPSRMNETQKEIWSLAYSEKKAEFETEKPEGRDLVEWKYRRYMQDYLGCIASVDEGIGKILDYIAESGLDKETYVFYTSDQGFFLGDHGWYDKRFMYEESLRMPLLAGLPGAAGGLINQDLVTNLDFAPTFLDLAGTETPSEMQGSSLKPFLDQETVPEWRESIYYHYYEYPAVHQTKRHYGVRTRRYKLIRFYYDIEAWELYDLHKDPHELQNLVSDPAYTEILKRLKAELFRLREYYGDSPELDSRFLSRDLERKKRI